MEETIRLFAFVEVAVQTSEPSSRRAIHRGRPRRRIRAGRRRFVARRVTSDQNKDQRTM